MIIFKDYYNCYYILTLLPFFNLGQHTSMSREGKVEVPFCTLYPQSIPPKLDMICIFHHIFSPQKQVNHAHVFYVIPQSISCLVVYTSLCRKMIETHDVLIMRFQRETLGGQLSKSAQPILSQSPLMTRARKWCRYFYTPYYEIKR